MTMPNLIRQASPIALDAAAVLCGMHEATPAFRNWARARAALPEPVRTHDIAAAYLRDTLADLERMCIARQLDAIAKRDAAALRNALQPE